MIMGRLRGIFLCLTVASGGFLLPGMNPEARGAGSDGYTFDVAVTPEGKRICVVNGTGLVVLERTPQGGLVRVGGVRTPGYARNLVLRDGLAFIATMKAGVTVYDIKSRGNPVEKGRISTPGEAMSIDIGNKGIACVSLGKKGICTLDIAKTPSMKILGHVPLQGDAWDVKVSGNYAYAACMEWDLVVVEIARPRNPKVVGAVKGEGGHSEIVYLWKNLALLADANAGLAAIDVTNPTHPREVGRWSDGDGYVEGVFANGSHAYISFGRKGNRDTGLRIIDISSPEDMKEVGRVNFPGWVEGVFVYRNQAFVANTQQGLYEINVSNPANPKGVKGHEIFVKASTGTSGPDRHWQGVGVFRQGKYQQSIQIFKQVVAKQPKRNWSWYLLGRSFYEIKEYQQALEAFTSLVQMCPWAPYHYQKGMVLQQLGRQEEAASELKKALEQIDSDTGYSLFRYADGLEGKRVRTKEEILRLLKSK